MLNLSGFQDIAPLGSGGLGDVYRAVRTSTGSVVAIKVLRDWSDASAAWQRAHRELRALVDLRGHPFVVHVEDIIERDGITYLVMEFAPGGSVADLLRDRDGPLELGEVVLIGEQTASALRASHQRGIIHLDIKPQNLLIGPFGQVKVCDFGIAALTHTEQFRERTSAASYRYASPEQLNEEPNVGAPADVYALGATLIHLLTGKPLPVRGIDSTGGHRPLEWTRPPDVDPAVCDRLEALLQSATAINPAARPDITRVHEELEAIAADLGAARRKSLPMATVRPMAAPPTQVRGDTGATTLPPPAPTVALDAPSGSGEGRGSRWRWIIAAAVVAFAAAAGTFFALAGGEGGDDDAAASSTEAAVTETAAPPAETAVAVTEAGSPATTAPPDPTDPPTTPPATDPPTTTIATVDVPAVLGRPLEEAQAMLAEANLQAQVVEVEGPGPYGEVVEVDPRVGADVAPGDVVVLTVNVQPSVLPDVIGQHAATATRTLESYGITVTTTEVLVEGRDGEVVDQTPKPGEPFPAAVELAVGRRAEIVYLADLDAVDGGYYSNIGRGQAQLNGELYTRALYFGGGTRRPGYLEFDLARGFTRLVGVVGPRDDVPSDTVLKIEIYLDGVVAFDETLALGQTAEIDLDVTQVLRLRLQVLEISQRGRYQPAVFADIRAIGLPGEVPDSMTD